MSNKSLAFVDPSAQDPKLLFNDGTVGGSGENYNPTIAAIPGTLSTQWDITQWSADQYLDPAAVTMNTSADQLLGSDLYKWATRDGKSGVDVYGTPGDYTYRLTSKGGSTTSPKDTYLQTLGSAPENFNFGKKMVFTANERISQIFGGTASGPTMAQNDVVVQFNVPGTTEYTSTLPTISTFLQFPLTDSRGIPGQYMSDYNGEIIYNTTPMSGTGNQALLWQADTGPLHQVTIDLNSAVTHMAQWLFNAEDTQGAGQSILDASRWTLAGFYAGMESLPGNGGSLDISHPLITRDDDADYSSSDAVATTVSVSGGVTYADWQMPSVSELPSVTMDNTAETDSGTSTTFTSMGGLNNLTLTAASTNATYTGIGTNVITDNALAGTTTLTGGSGSSDTIIGASGTSAGIYYTSTASATAFINPGSANVTIMGAGGMGTETVWGGEVVNTFTGRLTVSDGNGYYQGGTAGGNLINSSATGHSTLIGGGNGDLLQANGVGDMVVSGSGVETLDGSGSQGGLNLFTANSGASLMYGSQTEGDTFFLNQTSVSANGFRGAFFNMHTAPNATLQNLNNNVSNTIAIGFSGTDANYGTVGDFISGVDRIVLQNSIADDYTLTQGSIAGSNGQVSYTNLTTSNGSLITFYNAAVVAGDIYKA